jgi:putative cardiolipin synthase
MAAVAADTDAVPASTNAAVALLADPHEALTARIALIDAARASIDAQYYLWFHDTAGRLLMQRLLAAADRGVRVRVLLDDIQVVLRDLPWVALAHHPRIEVRVVNPFRVRGRPRLRRVLEGLARFSLLNRRMHNKALIVDGIEAIVGGRNIGNEYFGISGASNFRDLDVLVSGAAAGAIGASFERFWTAELACPMLELNRVRLTPLRLARGRARLDRFAGKALIALAEVYPSLAVVGAEIARLRNRMAPASVRVLADTPDKFEADTESVVEAVCALTDRAEHEVLLESAYFVPTASRVEALAALRARGVRVRVLTNSLASTDVPLVHGGYARWRGTLIDAGVELHELRPTWLRPLRFDWRRPSRRASLHTKAGVVDRRYAIVGSMNLDPRSAALNSEIGVLIDCPSLAAALCALLDRSASPDHAYAVERAADGRLRWRGQDPTGAATVERREPLAGRWRRAVATLTRLLPIERWL